MHDFLLVINRNLGFS